MESEQPRCSIPRTKGRHRYSGSAFHQSISALTSSLESLPCVVKTPQGVFVACREIGLLPRRRRAQKLRGEIVCRITREREGLAKRVVGVDAQVLGEVDVRNAGVAANYQHVLVVGVCTGVTEVR